MEVFCEHIEVGKDHLVRARGRPGFPEVMHHRGTSSHPQHMSYSCFHVGHRASCPACEILSVRVLDSSLLRPGSVSDTCLNLSVFIIMVPLQSHLTHFKKLVFS